MNFINLLKTAKAISQTMSDTLDSSFAWSGASRLINGVINKDTSDFDVFGKLVARKNLIVNPKKIPTPESVVTLMMSDPEATLATEDGLAALGAIGIDQKSVESQLRADHHTARVRAQTSATNIKAHKAAIMKTLREAFDVEEATTDKYLESLPKDIEYVLYAKIIEKVAVREATLVGLIGQGRMAPAIGIIELKKVRAFLAEHEAIAA